MFTIERIIILLAVSLISAFCAGWKIANWRNDSIALAISQANQQQQIMNEQTIATVSATLENKLQELKANERHFETVIQTEIVKPVFNNICVSDDFVRLFNDATAINESALSRKSIN